MTPQQQAEELLATLVGTVLTSVSASVQLQLGAIDTNPQGLEAVVVPACLYALADVISTRLEPSGRDAMEKTRESVKVHIMKAAR